MSISYVSRPSPSYAAGSTYQYLNLEDADERDRVEVVLQDAQIVTFKLGQKQPCLSYIEVDRELTSMHVLEDLYQHLHDHLTGNLPDSSWGYGGIIGSIIAWWERKHPPSPENIRTNAVLELCISDRDICDSFDESPRISKALCITPRYPRLDGDNGWGGGRQWRSSSPVASVRFYSLDD